MRATCSQSLAKWKWYLPVNISGVLIHWTGMVEWNGGMGWKGAVPMGLWKLCLSVSPYTSPLAL